jgi:chemotaxis protein MotB
MLLFEPYYKTNNNTLIQDNKNIVKIQVIRKNWIISFADLLSVMLVFFILLYSTSDIVTENDNQRAIDKTGVTLKAEQLNEDSIVYLYKLLTMKLNNESTLSAIKVTLLDDSLVISMPAQVMFEKHSEKLSLRAISLMTFLESYLYDIPNALEIIMEYNPYSKLINIDLFSDICLQLERVGTIAQDLKNSGYMNFIALTLQYNNSNVNIIKIVIHDEKMENNA